MGRPRAATGDGPEGWGCGGAKGAGASIAPPGGGPTTTVADVLPAIERELGITAATAVLSDAAGNQLRATDAVAANDGVYLTITEASLDAVAPALHNPCHTAVSALCSNTGFDDFMDGVHDAGRLQATGASG